MPIQSVLDFAHHVVEETLSAGDVAVDATVGNGHDTLALARAVGVEGEVFGMDVQAEALDQARTRLASEGVEERVTLLQEGHETMEAHVPASVRGRVGAVMFNLGYLPGSTSTLTTTPETTIPALKAASALLRPEGVMTVVLYTGHEGGPAEAAAVDSWATDLPQEKFQALSYRFVNQKNHPPRLVVVEKRAA
ncbi:16S rRNA (cytosine(1402)-N(4))-methyltransferase [Salinibacter sp. 10B]|uniref:class I SAM-dependent methyltransferase n=1 Tax=Salinibacter sp. 10B TaxID=1923971 RepID=UPI000CF3F855|nr:class I SAM-dependent methyltransferase [Salinibacter sp. 10B]PQJ35855.1 16S rRNA (cytosine(1402)-N(4))-methyltransferase [Salinibacter sp. 10B]